MTDCTLLCVRPEYLASIWKKAKPFILAGVERCDFSDFESIERDVFNSNALLWVAHDGNKIAGALVTQITETGRRKICTLVAGGGNNRARWIALLEQIEQYAREEGCSASRIIGREGWSAVLPDYRQRCVVLEKDLGNGRNV